MSATNLTWFWTNKVSGTKNIAEPRFFLANIFIPQIFLWSNVFSDQASFTQNFFYSHLFLKPNFFSQFFFWLLHFLDTIFFRHNIFFYTKFLAHKMFLDLDFYWIHVFVHPFFWTLILFQTQYRFWPNIFFGLKICLEPKKCLTTNSVGHRMFWTRNFLWTPNWNST